MRSLITFYENLLLLFACFVSVTTLAQTVPDSLDVNPQNQQNASQRILSGINNSGLTVGGYGEITYNQPEGDNGKLDVHRMVLFFGYKNSYDLLSLYQHHLNCSELIYFSN